MIEATLEDGPKLKMYPRLMIDDRATIVLFTGAGVGTVVSSEKNEIGSYSNNWNLSVFSDYIGRVKLQNV